MIDVLPEHSQGKVWLDEHSMQEKMLLDRIVGGVLEDVVSLFVFALVLSKDSLEEFIEDGQADALSKTAPPHQDSSIIAGVYYILADDALRSMDNA